MASKQSGQDRILGVWGPGAYAWSGEERMRAAGFPLDPSGRQRVLGFPGGPPMRLNGGWLRRLARAVQRH